MVRLLGGLGCVLVRVSVCWCVCVCSCVWFIPLWVSSSFPRNCAQAGICLVCWRLSGVLTHNLLHTLLDALSLSPTGWAISSKFDKYLLLGSLLFKVGACAFVSGNA